MGDLSIFVELESSGPEGNKKLTLPTKIGRRVGNKIVPKEDNGIFESQVLSRAHAEIIFENGKVMIIDLGSSNGTFLNEEKIDPNSKVELKDGSQLDFGVDVFNEEGEIQHKKVSTIVRFVQKEAPKEEVVELPDVFVKSLPGQKQDENNEVIIESVLSIILGELQKQKEIKSQLLELQQEIDSGRISFEPPGQSNDTIKLQREIRIIKKRNADLEQQIQQTKILEEEKEKQKKEIEKLQEWVVSLEKENKELRENREESLKSQEEITKKHLEEIENLSQIVSETVESETQLKQRVVELSTELEQVKKKPEIFKEEENDSNLTNEDLAHKVKTLEDLISQLREEVIQKNLFIRKLEWRGERRKSDSKLGQRLEGSKINLAPVAAKSSKIRDIQKIFEPDSD